MKEMEAGGKFSSEEFEKRLGAFEAYVNQITMRDTNEITLEERRKKILGKCSIFCLFVEKP